MRSETFEITVRAPERYGFVDLTAELSGAVELTGIRAGCSTAFCVHTTCCLLLNEWEDGVLEDLCIRLESLVPRGLYYAHDDPTRRKQNLEGEDERRNGQAHVISMIVGGSSHAIPVREGAPALGRWQRLFLHELDEPKDRRVVFNVIGA